MVVALVAIPSLAQGPARGGPATADPIRSCEGLLSVSPSNTAIDAAVVEPGKGAIPPAWLRVCGRRHRCRTPEGAHQCKFCAPCERPAESAHDLFLVLWLDPLHGERTCTPWALRGSSNLDLFIHTLRNRSPVGSPVSRSRLPPRIFGIALRLPSPKRCDLPSSRSQRRLQFLPQPFVLLLRSLLLPHRLAPFRTRKARFLRQLPNPAKRLDGLEEQTLLQTKTRLFSAP